MATVLTLHATYSRKSESILEVVEFPAYDYLPASEALNKIARSRIKHFDHTIAGFELTKLIAHINTRKFE